MFRSDVLLQLGRLQGTAIKADADVQDAVHVLVFLVPAEAVSDEDYISKLLELKEYARVRGKRELVLIGAKLSSKL